MRKEPIVFGGAVLLLGWLFWSSRSAGPTRVRGDKRADPPEFVRHPAPDTSIVLPPPGGPQGSRQGNEGRARDLFSPPSDTHPLPPLELDPLPRAPLAMLSPPPQPGPGPATYGRFLRVKPYRSEVPDLFGAGAAPDVGVDSEAAELGAGSAAEGTGTRPADLTPEEKAQRISGLKKLYDWVRTVEFKFGQIQNKDRFQLPRRPNEDILFVEFNPATGRPRLEKQGPVPLARSMVTEFDFADTVLNQIEKRRAAFDEPVPASQYEAVLAFADWCVEQRLETPRALEVAEEIYQRAMTVLSEDPAPHLGLARCYEAGFEFEKAFQEYRTLLTGAHERDPLVLSRLAALEARFRLFPQAEEHFVEAERYGRSHWQVQHAFGRFLHERGRTREAIEHLRSASQYEPAGAEKKQDRARIRVDLATALLHLGDLAGATEWFEKARQADPSDQRALAGALSVASLSEAGGADGNRGGADGARSGGDGSPGGSARGGPRDGTRRVRREHLRPGQRRIRSPARKRDRSGLPPRSRVRAARAPRSAARGRGGSSASLPSLARALVPGGGDRTSRGGAALRRAGRGERSRRCVLPLPPGPPARRARRPRGCDAVLLARTRDRVSTFPTRSPRWGRSRTGAASTRRPSATSSAL